LGNFLSSRPFPREHFMLALPPSIRPVELRFRISAQMVARLGEPLLGQGDSPWRHTVPGRVIWIGDSSLGSGVSAPNSIPLVGVLAARGFPRPRPRASGGSPRCSSMTRRWPRSPRDIGGRAATSFECATLVEPRCPSRHGRLVVLPAQRRGLAALVIREALGRGRSVNELHGAVRSHGVEPPPLPT